MGDYPWREGQAAGAEPAGQRLQETGERAGRAARQAEERTRHLRNRLYQGAERARALAAEGLTRAANTLRGSSPGTDTAARRFAEDLERGASYLRQTDLEGMQRDVAQLVRRYPGQALGVAFVAGLLLGQGMRRR